MTKAEIDAKMEDIIEFSEVRDFIDTPVKRYSSGMFVKLAFSVAAHLDSEIMIMDEVLAVGDMAFQKKCLTKMRSASRQDGRTVLYVSHNMNTIRQLCDRCIVLDKGRIIFEGDVDEAIALYLNTADDEETVFTDLSRRERPENSTNRAHMENVMFLEREDCILKRGEKLDFRLRWKAVEDIEDVKYRMIVRYQDDSAVGLVQSGVLGSFTAGQELEHVFRFDTGLLADGKYSFSMVLFQSDDIGNSVVLDHVTRACSVEIISPNDDDKLLNWEHRWWGSIRFPDLEILQ
jgi:lipopolysaccharide transport system ATP-binding protein